MEEDITRFDIPMHDVEFGQYLEGLHQILEVPQRLLLGKPSLAFDLLVQSTSIAEFIDEVVVVGSFEDLYKSHHVGGILDFG
jgi:hypothetical protein